MKTIIPMDYTIHGSTIFIKGNNVIGHYMIHGNEVFKSVRVYTGDEIMQLFHKLGDLPMNSEASLLNRLREEGKI